MTDAPSAITDRGFALTPTGQDMYICAESPTVSKMAADLSKVLKVQVETLGLSKEEFYSAEHRESTGEAMWAQYRVCYER